MGTPEIQADLIVEGAAEVVTCAGISQSDSGAIPDGAVACSGERIVFVGSAAECRRRVALTAGGRHIDARGGTVLPGFVDSHTHLPFAGWRDAEFEKRLAGATYLELAAAGGGILSTVRATRAASSERLLALLHERLDAMLLSGTTTAEAKSGYGLSLESELRLLEAIASASDHPVELVPTFLGAHIVAPEFRDGRRGEYIRLIVEEMIPRIAERSLARFCDVFIDEGAFTVEEARTILESARTHGLGLRVHAGQLTWTGGVALAASLGAASVDHLEQATEEDVAALARTWRGTNVPGRLDRGSFDPGFRSASAAGAPGAYGAAEAYEPAGAPGTAWTPEGSGATGADSGGDGHAAPHSTTRAAGTNSPVPQRSSRSGTVAILLPGASFFLQERSRPPARALIDAGVPVALATDFNPGSSPCLAVLPILNLACLLFGMTPDEAIVAATRHAALSLGIEDRVGTLEPGKQADLVVWDVPGRRHLAYRFGPLPCRLIVKRGTIVVEDGRLTGRPLSTCARGGRMLVDLTLEEFLARLSSDSPTPGGGSVSALAGAQGAALLDMVIAVTLKNERFAASRAALAPIQAKAIALREEFSVLADRDAESYDAVVAANRLPKESPEEKAVRKAAREKALRFATEVPLKTAELAASLAALANEVAPQINPNAASDLIVAALLAESALGGAAANVRINLDGLKSPDFAGKANERLRNWADQTAAKVASVRAHFPSLL